MDKNSLALALSLAILCASCARNTEGPPKIPSADFGNQNGHTVQIYTLTNKNGVEARITNYGATLVSLKVPDRSGKLDDIVFGFDSVDGYTQTPPPPYFGATIGRYANRIGGAKFTLDGKMYTLEKNDGMNSLHGGNHGFDKVTWSAKPSTTKEGPSVQLSYISSNAEGGYPGSLTANVQYTLTDKNELRIHYTAASDQDTVVNLTNHSYFNLSGLSSSNGASGEILDHVLTINADRFTPVDSGLIPTGELRNVAGTPFDFRQPHPIGERIESDDEQIKLGHGYDHNWVLNRTGSGLELAAKVVDPKSGRVLEVLTDQPGIQFYTGNFLDGSFKGKGGKVYQHRGALCLETQHYPDSPNHPDFPSTELKSGQTYDTTTVFRFSAQ